MRIRNFSLLGLLTIVACAGIGASHVITSIQLSRANKELAALRKRLELIPVDSADQIAARRLPSSDENVRRWAVRLPQASSKVLYANWGTSSLADIRDINSSSTRVFRLVPDPATQEAAILFRVERNPNDLKWGVLKIEAGNSTSVIAINPEITSLLMGETPCQSEAIGDIPVTRLAVSPITLFATESSGNPKSAFCLWLDQSPRPDGG